MNNKNIRSVIAIGVIILLAVLCICIFVNRSYTGETVYDHTETQISEQTPEPESYGEISTEQIEAGAVEGPEGFTIEEEEPEEIPVYVFRNEKLLNEHYEKHGIEMGFASAEEYEKAASAVVNSPDALHKKEKDDNDDVYYIEDTNEFVVVSSDGYLRTYFLPDKGKAYYDRQ